MLGRMITGRERMYVCERDRVRVVRRVVEWTSIGWLYRF